MLRRGSGPDDRLGEARGRRGTAQQSADQAELDRLHQMRASNPASRVRRRSFSWPQPVTATSTMSLPPRRLPGFWRAAWYPSSAVQPDVQQRYDTSAWKRHPRATRDRRQAVVCGSDRIAVPSQQDRQAAGGSPRCRRPPAPAAAVQAPRTSPAVCGRRDGRGAPLSGIRPRNSRSRSRPLDCPNLDSVPPCISTIRFSQRQSRIPRPPWYGAVPSFT